MSYTKKALAAASALLIGAPAATLAHTNSIGYVGGGGGSVTFWYGNWHPGTTFNEGNLTLQGINGTNFAPSTVNWTLLQQTQPDGLIPGTNYFTSDGTQLVPYPSNPISYTWQGVTFTGLAAGDYQFTYNAAGSPTVNWMPMDSVILSSTVTLSAAALSGDANQNGILDIYETGGTPPPPTVVSSTTSNVVTTSTSSSTRTETSYVTRTETSTDADGNSVVRTYTDTIVTTIPVTTTTTTTTPVTTDTYSDGSTTSSNGTPVVTTSSVDGTGTPAVTSTALDATAVTRTVVTSSTASSATTATRTVTRTVTETDANGNPVVRTYTDTILDTTPVITTTTTTTPVTTTYNADGTTSVTEGTPVITSTSVNGTVGSSVIATSLVSTAVTVNESLVLSDSPTEGLPVVKTTLTEHKASEDDGVQKIARKHTTTTTTGMTKTIQNTPVTTTTTADGDVTITRGTSTTSYEFWNDVDISISRDALYGRVDQHEVLDKFGSVLNDLVSHEPDRSAEPVRVFNKNYFGWGEDANGYTAKSKVYGGGLEIDIKPTWTIGGQYNNINVDLDGPDSTSSLRKNHYGFFSMLRGNDLSLGTNVGFAQNHYSVDRNVENVFANSSSNKGKEWWVSNKLYWHLNKWITPVIGYTVGGYQRDGFTESGSIQSARTVGAVSETTHSGEAGLVLSARFGGKKHNLFGIGMSGVLSTNRTGALSAVFDVAETLYIEGIHQHSDGAKNNMISTKVKFKF